MHLAKDDAIMVWGLLGLGVVIVSLGIIFTYGPPSMQPVGEQITNQTQDLGDSEDGAKDGDGTMPLLPQEFIINNGDRFQLSDNLIVTLFSLPVASGSASDDRPSGGRGGGGGGGGGGDSRDRTPPEVTGIFSRPPDIVPLTYTHPFNVTWVGEDRGSGIDFCDPPEVYSGPDGISIELEGQCTDNAGNEGTGSVKFDYNATLFVPIFSYSLTLSDDTINAGSDVTATAATNNTVITQVVFSWKDPSNSTAASNVRHVTVGDVRTAIDIFTVPDLNGVWTLDAHFQNASGNDIATRSKVFNVQERDGTANHRPVAINDTAITPEDVAVVINVKVNDFDPDGDSFFIFSFTQAANGSVTKNINDTFTYIPQANYNGQDAFTYKISDGSLESNFASVAISISSTNDAPVANAGPDQFVSEESPVLLDGSAFDVDSDNLTFSWSQLSGPVVSLTNADTLAPSLVAPSISHSDPASLQITLTFELVVVDDEGASSSDTVAVVVNDVNKAPAADAGQDQIVNESILCRENEEEDSGKEDNGDCNEDDNSRASAVSESKDENEECEEKYDGNASIETASGGNDDEKCPKPSTVTLSGSGSDPDGDPLTFKWEQTDGPLVELNDANSLTPSFTAPEVDDDTLLTFELTVSDGFGGVAADTVDILVLDIDDDPRKKIKVTGGGGIGKDVKFSFKVQSKGGETTGQLEYKDKDSGIKLHSISITSLTLEDENKATFEGIAKVDGREYGFVVEVEDNGEPGKKDKFTITIPELDYMTGGKLAKGNIQIHE